ncbi:hypothetical protein [Allosalinactinospora lopnorensis]|uniref:hypothetical protein n=1 Tax=Allosalinactinospora lopnorensis TaxID=1352348 RepID=UPI00191BDDC3|nr:hypothetical protein [Allosalinactinospora lopnorensis]
MIQDPLVPPEWQGVLTDADQRGLTPVFHTNMTLYGEIQLNLDKRLALSAIDTPRPPAGS